MIGLVAMVPVIVASQGSVALIQTYPHRWGPLEVGEVPDDRQEPVICNVESSELGGIFLLFRLPLGALMSLDLTALLIGRAFSGRLATLSGDHDCL